MTGTWAALGFLGAWAWYGMALTGQEHAFLDTITASAGFNIRQVEIRGLAEADATEIVDRMDISSASSLLMLDAETARARIAEIPWVADVEVRKLYPGHLVVSLHERLPYALWQDEGKVRVVDKTGAVMSDTRDPRNAGLPLVVGRGANLKVVEASEILNAVPSLRAKMRAAVLVAERRWNLVTMDGVEIRLPEDNPAQALTRVAKLDSDKKLLDRDIVAVDMRANDRVYVKLSDAAADSRREAIKARNKKKGTDT